MSQKVDYEGIKTAQPAKTLKGNLAGSFACAFRGIYVTLKSERNIKIHLVAMCLSIALGIYLNLSILQWGLIIFCIGFVLATELFNTALEKLSDSTSDGKFDPVIRNIKDISAAAVLLAAITALIIGVLILFIPFIHRISELL